jgi:hypothetical protein
VSFAGLAWLSDAIGIPFRILLRLPFAIFDLATAALVLWLLGDRSWRFAGLAAYWLHPLAILYSAYHGNTDSVLLFFFAAAIGFLLTAVVQRLRALSARGTRTRPPTTLPDAEG